MTTLMIMRDPSKNNSFIAEYTNNQLVEESHDIGGDSRDNVIANAAAVWGIDIDNTLIDFTDY